MSAASVHSAVRLLGVTVERLVFEDTLSPERRGHELLIQFRIERRTAADSPRLAECAFSVSIRGQEGEPRFVLDATVVGVFQQDSEDENMPLDRFMLVNGPAQVVPFVRELVTNITTRSKGGPIMLPSVNLVSLVQEIEKARQSTS